MDIGGHALVFSCNKGLVSRAWESVHIFGISKVCALALLRSGVASNTIANVYLESAETVAVEYRRAYLTDVISKDSVNNAKARVTYFSRRVHHVANSASLGILVTREVAQADTNEFKRLLNFNVTGTFLVIKCVSTIIKSQEPRPNYPGSPKRGYTRGTIVTLGSVSSFSSTPSIIQYTTSKSAVLGLPKNAALDNAAYVIRVNCAIDTVPDLGDHIDSAVPLGRIAQPEELADAVVFLSCPKSSYITSCPNRRVFLRPDQGKHYLPHHQMIGEQQALSNILYPTHQTPNSVTTLSLILQPPLYYQHGTVFRMIDFAPNEVTPLHRALLVDYGIILEGEFELILESGKKKIMPHQWRNLTGGGT
ncbi:NAD(P)-binding protein [Xylaria castorea]|nr:NAD(P)-binding protein [Xylaria castorea]